MYRTSVLRELTLCCSEDATADFALKGTPPLKFLERKARVFQAQDSKVINRYCRITHNVSRRNSLRKVAEGHESDEGMIKAVGSAKKHCRELHVLGSYPKSRRIL